MKKLLIFILALFLLTSCGGQSKQACMNNCIKTLSAICKTDQTATCANICDQENDIKNCIMSAESCEDLDKKLITCFSIVKIEKNIIDNQKNDTKEPSCESVCQKYAQCASFGDDIPEEDLKDAYESCMIECPSWSAKGLKCMDSKEIKNPNDCMALSLCGAMEYQDRF